MRVLVCGGRQFTDVAMLNGVLSKWASDADVVIHGAATGADTAAGKWAKLVGKRVEEYPADWKKYKKSAGPIRNSQMLDDGKPDLVIAFPGGRGTADMVQKAKMAGIPVMEIDNNGACR